MTPKVFSCPYQFSDSRLSQGTGNAVFHTDGSKLDVTAPCMTMLCDHPKSGQLLRNIQSYYMNRFSNNAVTYSPPSESLQITERRSFSNTKALQ